MNPVDPADLERVPLFAGLPPDALATLAAAASRRELADGEALFRQGDPATNLYILEQGSLVLRTEGGGASVIVDSLRPGGIVGWSAMREGAVTLSTGRAAGAARLVAIPVEPIIELVTNGDPDARRLFQRIVAIAAGHLEAAWSQLLRPGDEGIITGG